MPDQPDQPEPPALILLNGPPGSGKSTLAARYASDHPLTLCCDIDLLRALLGRWQDTPGEAGIAARAIALAAARTHLGGGHDVVVPQLLARPEFIDRLAALAAEAGVPFVEIVLLDDKENTRRRFVERTERAMRTGHTGHSEAAEQLERSGGLAQLDRYHDALVAMLPGRPDARVVPTRDGEVEPAYAEVLAVVGQVRSRGLREGLGAATTDR